MRILLIEDDKETALTVKEQLESSYIVEVAYTGEQGEYLAQINEYDLIILDYILPDIDGIQVCQTLRTTGITTPILMLTGQTESKKVVTALDSGADDYITKPFSFDELFARIRVLLRRQGSLRTNILKVDNLTFDLTNNIVQRKGRIIALRRKERYLLEYLMRNTGKVVTREMILDHIWDSSNESMTNIIDVHINYLREQVDKPFEKKLIKTVHGFGYKIEA